MKGSAQPALPENIGRLFLDAALQDAERTLHDMRISLTKITAPVTEKETQKSLRYVTSVNLLMENLYDTLEFANLKFLDENITADDLCNIFRTILDIRDCVPDVALFE